MSAGLSGHSLEWVDRHPFFPPMDMQGAAGTQTTGDWLYVGNAHKFAINFIGATGTAGQDPVMTVQQATSAAGAGAKALTFSVIWVIQPVGASDFTGSHSWSVGTGTYSAGTYTEATSAETCKWWYLPFTCDDLDADGGFDFVNCTFADVGGNAQLGVAFLEISLRYPARPTAHLSMIASN